MTKDYKTDFLIDPDVAYLNFAYMAPMLKTSREALDKAVVEWQNPYRLTSDHWFKPIDELRSLYTRIIGSQDPDRIAITPSCSYSMANITRQIRPRRGSNIVLAAGQFPSNYYSWKRLCMDHDCHLREVEPVDGKEGLSRRWSQAIVEAIDHNTSAVSMGPVFHADGTRLDLKAIGERCRQKNALLIVDGTQALGALPFYMEDIQPDAIVCSGYKWLFGPYGSGMAWYGGFFDNGIPIEENWIVHEGCEDFSNLNAYNMALQPKGKRYSSGQHAAMLHIALASAGARQILDWGIDTIQQHTTRLFERFKDKFLSLGGQIDEDDHRAHHIFGIRFPEGIDTTALKQTMLDNQVYASLRGDALRVSMHLLNTDEDLQRLIDCIKKHV